MVLPASRDDRDRVGPARRINSFMVATGATETTASKHQPVDEVLIELAPSPFKVAITYTVFTDPIR